MRKMKRITNAVLIFTLIGVFLCQDLSHAARISHLRVPVGSSERLRKYLSTQDLIALSKTTEIKGTQIEGIGERHYGDLTHTREVRYTDDDDRTHECFEKGSVYQRRFIVPQVRILRHLNNKGIKGIPEIVDFVEFKDGWKSILFKKFPPGETLEEKQRKGELSEDEAVRVLL